MSEFVDREARQAAVHFAVYLGWLLGRRLDDLLIATAQDLGLGRT